MSNLVGEFSLVGRKEWWKRTKNVLLMVAA